MRVRRDLEGSTQQAAKAKEHNDALRSQLSEALQQVLCLTKNDCEAIHGDANPCVSLSHCLTVS